MSRPRTQGAVRLREKTLANGSRSLYLDIYLDGKRSYDFLKIYLTGDKITDRESLRLAESIRARRELDLAADTHGVPRPRRDVDFLAYVKAHGERKTYVGWAALVTYLTRFAPTLNANDVTTARMREFRSYLLALPIAQNTARYYIALMRQVVRQAQRDGIVRGNPLDGLEPIRFVEPIVSYLTIDEIRALAGAECEDPDVKAAFLFACFTGLRISDIRRLTWGQIREGGIEYRQKKTRRVEQLPLSSQALGFLAGRPRYGVAEPGEHVFIIPSDYLLAKALTGWRAAAKVATRFTFHSSRHTFATLALEYGGDIATVSKLLGHRTIAMTQRYAKIVDRSKREVIDKMPTI